MYADKAEAIFARGFNCAQAVLGAFAEAYGMEPEAAMRAASSLGGGVAHTGEACGAALGMCMAVGLAKGYDRDPSQATKDAHNARIKALMETFRAEFGHMDCDDLRVPGNRALCAAYVRFAAELAGRAVGE